MGKTLFEDKAWDDYLYWLGQDRKIVEKINSLLESASRTPFSGLGKPEPLKGDLSGFWSRRITDEDRLVYRLRDGVLEILSCKGHYDA